MLERHGVDAVLLHQRVGRRIYAMYIEFFLEQPIDKGIDVERWTGRAANAETVIDKKAARTFQIKFNAGPAYLERFVGGWIKLPTRLDGKGLFHRAAISHQIWQTL